MISSFFRLVKPRGIPVFVTKLVTCLLLVIVGSINSTAIAQDAELFRAANAAWKKFVENGKKGRTATFQEYKEYKLTNVQSVKCLGDYLIIENRGKDNTKLDNRTFVKGPDFTFCVIGANEANGSQAQKYNLIGLIPNSQYSNEFDVWFETSRDILFRPVQYARLFLPEFLAKYEDVKFIRVNDGSGIVEIRFDNCKDPDYPHRSGVFYCDSNREWILVRAVVKAEIRNDDGTIRYSDELDGKFQFDGETHSYGMKGDQPSDDYANYIDYGSTAVELEEFTPEFYGIEIPEEIRPRSDWHWWVLVCIAGLGLVWFGVALKKRSA